MSKQKKGKKHRRVNRRPRPCGSAPGRAAAMPAAALPAAPLPTARASAESFEHAWELDQERDRERDSAWEAVFAVTVREGGLGQHAGRTWRQLRSAGERGATVDELCAAVGYQPETVRRHLKGLEGRGMATRRAGTWLHRADAAAGAAVLV